MCRISCGFFLSCWLLSGWLPLVLVLFSDPVISPCVWIDLSSSPRVRVIDWGNRHSWPAYFSQQCQTKFYPHHNLGSCLGNDWETRGNNELTIWLYQSLGGFLFLPTCTHSSPLIDFYFKQNLLCGRWLWHTLGNPSPINIAFFAVPVIRVMLVGFSSEHLWP